MLGVLSGHNVPGLNSRRWEQLRSSGRIFVPTLRRTRAAHVEYKRRARCDAVAGDTSQTQPPKAHGRASLVGQKLAYVLVHDDKAHSSGMSGLEVEDAVRLFLNESNMEQLESFHCGQCLAALNSRQEYELTIHAHSAMLKSVRCDARNAFCFTQVVTALRRLRRESEIEALAERMEAEGVVPDMRALNSFVAAAARAGGLTAARAMLERMRALTGGRLSPDVFTFTTLLAASSSMTREESATEAYRLFAAMVDGGVEPNTHAYTAFMTTLQRAGHWRQCLRVLRQMESKGLTADAVAYNTVIAGLARVGKWEEAWGLFSTMQTSGVMPTTVTFNALMAACDRARQPDRAMELLDRMKRGSCKGLGCHPDVTTYNTAISAVGKAGRINDALGLLDEMKAARMAPDAITMGSLLNACAQGDNWEQALQIFRQLVQVHGVQPNTVCVNAMMLALSRGRQWEEVMVVLDGIESGASPAAVSRAQQLLGAPLPSTLKADVYSYGIAMEASSRAHKWEGALKLLERMEQKGVPPNLIAYSSALAACERGNRWQQAAQIWERIRQAGADDNSLLFLARRIMYLFPGVLERMPGSLIEAARAAVDSGRATRQWLAKWEM